jgi:hypothetical protein
MSTENVDCMDLKWTIKSDLRCSKFVAKFKV